MEFSFYKITKELKNKNNKFTQIYLKEWNIITPMEKFNSEVKTEYAQIGRNRGVIENARKKIGGNSYERSENL